MHKHKVKLAFNFPWGHRSSCRHEDRLKQQRADWTKTIADLQSECTRYRSTARSAESTAHELREQIKRSEGMIEGKEQELNTCREKLIQASQKIAQLQTENNQIQETCKQHIADAQLTVKRESHLRKQELKSLQTQMKQVTENASRDQDELQRKLNEYYEVRYHRFFVSNLLLVSSDFTYCQLD